MASALPRPLDLSYPSNRYAAAGFLAAMLLSVVRGRSGWQPVGDGLASFAAWAIARELDPDDASSAAVALPIAVSTALLDATPHPVAAFTALSSVRVLGATVGHAPTGLDIAALLLNTLVAARTGQPLAALMPAGALALSAMQKDRFSPPQQAALIAASVLLTANASEQRGHLSDALSLAALATLPALLQPERIESKCDEVDVCVASERIQLGRTIAGGALAAGLVFRQSRSMLPLAAAVLSVGLRRLLKR